MTFASVFPGQGSQSINILNTFADYPAAATTLAEASGVLGQDIGKLVAEGPAEKLNLTANMQPVMLTAAVTVYRAWQAAGGPTPTVVAGHSLGKYSALVAVGAIAFRDAVPSVRFHTKAMQEAVPMGGGSMTVILGLSDDDVHAACAEVSVAGVVEAVNFNTSAQVVITGAKAAAEETCEIAKAKGVKRALSLPVSMPFHSSPPKPVSDHLREYLANMTVNAPVIPAINDVDVAVVSGPAAIKDALVRQAASPVHQVETVQKMKGNGITRVVKCGPDRVLAGLIKHIDGEIVGDAIFDPAPLEAVLGQLK